jgi:hypothetical protein|uniref:Lectin/glucanase superfamily protein n=1 Tax=viral metagenome TaxID=1070528 RepID=A0A6C0BE48_9ZZZZ
MDTRLTISNTYAQGVNFDNGGQFAAGNGWWTQNTFFACDVVFPTSFAHDCMLWEMGGPPGNAGAYVGVRDVTSGVPKLRVRGGDNALPPHANVVSVDVPIPTDGKLHEVCWEFMPYPAGSGLSRIRVWIDGILKGSAQGNFFVSGTTVLWAGYSPGNMGGVTSGTVTGESTNVWPNVISQPLRVYKNQLGPSNEAEGRLGVPTYEHVGGIFNNVTISESSFFSMDIVIPTSFSQSHVLFEYGGSGYGTYVGVVKSGTKNVLRVRSGNGSSTITYPGVPVANSEVVFAQTEDFPQDGLWHTISFDVRKKVAGNAQIRLWVDGRLVGEQVSLGSSFPYLCGSSGGGFGQYNSSVPAGESTNPWPSTVGSCRVFVDDAGSLPTNGPIFFSDIVSEYNNNITWIGHLYKTRPALTTGVWDQSTGIGRVDGRGAPEVPSAGPISLANFRGQRSRPVKRERITVTVPPDMTDFVLDQRSTLLTRSFANTTEVALASEGWTFNNANLITFGTTNIRVPQGVYLYSPVIKSVNEGISHVMLTVSGTFLEGGEVYRLYIQDVKSSVQYLLGSVPITTSVVTNTVSIPDTFDLSVVDLYSSDGVRIVISASIGPSDIAYLYDITIQKSEKYVCAASTNRADYLRVYNVFNSLATNSWQSNDGTYNIVAPDNTLTRLGSALRTFNGFNDGFNGEYIALRLPWPIFVSTMTVRGLCVDLLLYGSVNGTTFDLLHTVTGLSGVISTTHTINIPASDKSYSILVAKFTRMMPGGFNRGNMGRVFYTGTK